ncbi:MAG: hypothetical protein R3E18_07265 [Sphingomonadaceae bacterium]
MSSFACNFEMLTDQASSILVTDRDCRRALEGLVGIEQVKARIAALIDPVAIHASFRMKTGRVDKKLSGD